MAHLLLAWLLAQGPAVELRPYAGKPTYRVNLRPGRRDYQLISPPGPGAYSVWLAGAITAGKSKLIFATPLAPGRYALDIRSTLVGDDDQTFVFSVPLAGESTVVVSAGGKARYDFSFRVAGKKEYRFTVIAPVTERAFRLLP
jgi:hypothetical protein